MIKLHWIIGILLLFALVPSVMATHVPYNVTQYGNVTASITIGNLTSFPTIDNNVLNISEIAGAPAFDLRINFTGLGVGTEGYVYFDLYSWYNGNVGHEVLFQFWNYSIGGWSTLGQIISSTSFVQREFYANINDSKAGGITITRFYHTSPGNTNHYYSIDEFIATESDIPPARPLEYESTICPINTIQSTLLYIFIGLIIIGLGIWASYTTILFFSIIIGIVGIIYSFPLFGCSPVYGLVVALGGIFYILYEAFFRKFIE